MPIYRKRPVEIEAQQLTVDNLEQIAAWCKGTVQNILMPRKSRCIYIQTLEGEMRAEIEDWIIQGVKGEFYPCKPDIFEATYDLVDRRVGLRVVGPAGRKTTGEE